MDNERNNYAFWILCNRVTVPSGREILLIIIIVE